MQGIRLAVAGVLAVLGLVSVIEGQTLRAGQTVRVRLSDGQRFEAEIAGVDSSPVVLRFARSPQLVPVSSIDSLWLRRSSSGRGALIGGIVVGAFGLVLGVAWCDVVSESGPCPVGGYALAVGVSAVGAAGGALLGAGIGSLFHRWQPLGHPVTISLGVGMSSLKAGARIPF